MQSIFVSPQVVYPMVIAPAPTGGEVHETDMEVLSDADV